MNHKELKEFIADKLTEMYKVSSSKNDDYASSEDALSNFKESAAFAGVTPAQSAMVLIGTKISRIKNLVNCGSTPNNESIEDSLKDLRIYTILLQAILAEESKDDGDLDLQWPVKPMNLN